MKFNIRNNRKADFLDMGKVKKSKAKKNRAKKQNLQKTTLTAPVAKANEAQAVIEAAKVPEATKTAETEKVIEAVVQEQKKHFLTLHLSHKGQQKTIHFGIRHAVAACTAAALMLSGALYTAGAYQKTKTELQASEQQLLETERTNRKLEQRAELLENENNEYTENIQKIETKTDELEQKLNELETVKEDLYHQLETLNAPDSSSTAPAKAKLVSMETPVSAEGSTFIDVVKTPYHQTELLSENLDEMHTLMDDANISFKDVAYEVTLAVAAHTDVPTGWPVESGYVSTEFNPTADPSISDGRKHKGVDIATRSQIIPVYATASGTVTTAEYRDDYGYYVVIDHGNGFTTLYAHNSGLSVEVGDTVKYGDVIAMSGSTGMSTGVHVHYEIMLNGVYQNPRDFF